MGWLRHPCTTAERRANQDGWCRLKRNWKRLSDAWDDIINTSWRNKNWKRARDHQYKVVPIKVYNESKSQDGS